MASDCIAVEHSLLDTRTESVFVGFLQRRDVGPDVDVRGASDITALVVRQPGWPSSARPNSSTESTSNRPITSVSVRSPTARS